jgi:prefoldin subunit 5
MKEDIKARIEALEQTIQQSQAQHNALIGRREEAKYLLETLEKMEKDKKDGDTLDHASEDSGI